GARGPDRGGRGLPLAARILPGTQQALVQLTHVLRQGAWVFRPLVGPPDGRGAVLWGHRLLLPRGRRPRPAPPDTVGAWHRHWCGYHPAPWHSQTHRTRNKKGALQPQPPGRTVLHRGMCAPTPHSPSWL